MRYFIRNCFIIINLVLIFVLTSCNANDAEKIFNKEIPVETIDIIEVSEMPLSTISQETIFYGTGSFNPSDFGNVPVTLSIPGNNFFHASSQKGITALQDIFVEVTINTNIPIVEPFVNVNSSPALATQYIGFNKYKINGVISSLSNFANQTIGSVASSSSEVIVPGFSHSIKVQLNTGDLFEPIINQTLFTAISPTTPFIGFNITIRIIQ